jgi:type I restriction enzyme R subunit
LGLLSHIISFADADLEKLYAFSRLLRRYLPKEREELPVEIQENIDIDSYRIKHQWKGNISLERGNGKVEPQGVKGEHIAGPEIIEPLSQIIRELNERFGRVFIETLEARLAEDQSLTASVRVNTPENARLTFDYVVTDRLQDMVETNFKLYKRINDDQEFSKFFLGWLFERFRKNLKKAE